MRDEGVATPGQAAAAGHGAGHFPWLVADIGGTNARFGLVLDGGLQVQRVHQLAAADHPGPVDAARAYLATHGVPGQPPQRAAFAVATAVGGDRVEFTNSAWGFSRHAAADALALDALLVLNDFEALALSLPGLGPQQLSTRGAALPQAGTLAVVGPGTGLGVAGVVPTANGWQALPGEGGHATLAPFDDFESAVLAAARQRFDHVSAERLLSGIGLPVLHRAVAQVLGVDEAVLDAAQISARALDGSSPACARTVDVFCAMLGGFAGNVALTLGARGGVYIGGGIVPRWGERFFASAFRERFEAKGRFRSYLEAIPTAVITDTHAALGGAVLALAQHPG